MENLQRLEMFTTSVGVGVGGGGHEAEERTAQYLPARCGVLASAGAWEERRESTSEAEWKWAHCGHNTNGSFIIKVLFSGKI